MIRSHRKMQNVVFKGEVNQRRKDKDQKKLWTNQDGLQHHGQEEANDEEPQSSETVRTPDSDEGSSESSEPETDDSEKAPRKRFSCSKCGKHFITQRSLRRHVPCHGKEKSLSCSVCAKCFRCNSELVKHMRIHTGEKPYSCDLCGKCFARRESVVSHMKSHTGEKPFGCSFCPKRFRSKQHVETHTRIHTGEKPFACKLCPKCFCSKSEVTRHTRVHMGQKAHSMYDMQQMKKEEVSPKQMDQDDLNLKYIKEEEDEVDIKYCI